MKTYNTSNPLEKQQFLLRANKLAEKGKVVQMGERKPQRSLKQNAYLWLILAYWGTQTGYTKEEAEAIYKDINKDLYQCSKEAYGREYTYTRHTYELDTEQMTQSIERFRNWSAMNEACPVYIPAPNESYYFQEMEMEVEKNKEFMYSHD